jgi:hypothetical protein
MESCGMLWVFIFHGFLIQYISMQIMNQYHQNPGKSIDATQINHLWELFGSGQAELPQNPCLGFWNIGFTRKVSRLNLQAYLFLSICS